MLGIASLGLPTIAAHSQHFKGWDNPVSTHFPPSWAIGWDLTHPPQRQKRNLRRMNRKTRHVARRGQP
jgi:hypothetical protein